MKVKSFLSAFVIIGLILSLLGEGAPLFAGAESDNNDNNEGSPLEVIFSHESGFYDSSFNLTLTATDENAKIYYALNGIPTSRCVRDTDFFTQASVTQDVLYNAPLSVTAGALTDVFSIRAYAVIGDEYSTVVVKNYVKGVTVNQRFSDETLIFTLNSDPHGLYNYYDGVFEFGIDRYTWREEYRAKYGKYPTQGYTWDIDETPASPANFNRRGDDSGRRAYLEMFDSQGTSYIAQEVEMRVKGGYSRAHCQKSLELYARDKEGEWNPFRFPFFNENSSDGQLMYQYRRIRLRNGGSDRTDGFIRDELGSSLLKQAGLPTTQMHTPAAVFLNGEYYGVAWVKTPRTGNHLRRKHGGVTENYWYLEGGESYWESDVPEAIVDWQYNVYEYAKGGLVDDARWNTFKSRVNIDDLMLYYAFQIYIQNQDWPNHNMEMWRYVPTDEEKADPNFPTILREGKWTWLPHDMDAAFNSWNDAQASINTIHNILYGGTVNNPQWQGTSALLKAILERNDMKARFANTLVDLMEGVMLPDNVDSVLSGLSSRLIPELSYASSVNKINYVDQWGHPSWNPTEGSYRGSWGYIRSFINQRSDYMYGFISTTIGSQFNRYARFAVNTSTSVGGIAVMNCRLIDENDAQTGNYYNGTTIDIKAKPYPGYEISHWVINGVQMPATEVVTIGGASTVELYFKKSLDLGLYISAVKGTSFNSAGNDWVEIYNPTDKAVSTRGLYLSDSSNNLFKWQLPGDTIQPDSVFRFVTNGNGADSAAKKRARLNFNLGFGETLRLTKADGEILSSVNISFMRANEVQKCDNSRKYTIEKPPPVCSNCGGALPCYNCITPASLQLVVRDSTSWGNSRSAPVDIKGNGTFTETLTVIVGQPRIVNFALMTTGGKFADKYEDNFEDAGPPVADGPASSLWNARVTINEILVNGTVPIQCTGGELPLIYQNDVHSGHIFVPLWDAWNTGVQRLTGANVAPTVEGSSLDRTALAIVGAQTIMTVTVTFTVTGI
ncbi:MAG: CotH kinase family protein [Oscillospiraceae bacterium]|nr:CotH kinase family protein [Oscillospiraceae bacterium]